MEALAFVLSSTTQRTSNRFAEADRANSLIATGPETHSGKDDALCQRIPKNPPPPSRRPCMTFWLPCLPIPSPSCEISARGHLYSLAHSPHSVSQFVHLYPSPKSNVDDAYKVAAGRHGAPSPSAPACLPSLPPPQKTFCVAGAKLNFSRLPSPQPTQPLSPSTRQTDSNM